MLNIEWTSSPKDSIDWLSGILYKLIDYLSLKYPVSIWNKMHGWFPKCLFYRWLKYAYVLYLDVKQNNLFLKEWNIICERNAYLNTIELFGFFLVKTIEYYNRYQLYKEKIIHIAITRVLQQWPS